MKISCKRRMMSFRSRGFSEYQVLRYILFACQYSREIYMITATCKCRTYHWEHLGIVNVRYAESCPGLFF